jgi:hypothetical protein
MIWRAFYGVLVHFLSPSPPLLDSTVARQYSSINVPAWSLCVFSRLILAFLFTHLAHIPSVYSFSQFSYRMTRGVLSAGMSGVVLYRKADP